MSPRLCLLLGRALTNTPMHPAVTVKETGPVNIHLKKFLNAFLYSFTVTDKDLHLIIFISVWSNESLPCDRVRTL